MSILETFYILFKSDASQFKKDAGSVEKVNEALNKSFLEMGKTIGKWAGSVVAAERVISSFKNALSAGRELDVTSRLLGVQVDKLQEWSYAAEFAGGSAKGFQGSLHNLAEQLGTSSAVALELLPQFAEVFGRLGRVQALRYGKAIGLDEQTILFLQRGRREVEAIVKQQRELGVITEQDREKFQKFNEATTNLNHSFQFMWAQVVLAVLPALTKLEEVVTKVFSYLAKHKDLVIGALIGIGAAAAVMLAPFILMAGEIILIGAGIAGLIALFAALYEDVKAFVTGHNSLIGDLIHKYPLLGEAIKNAFNAWTAPFRALKAALDYVTSAIDKVQNYFGGSKKLEADLKTGQVMIGAATTSPIASQTGLSLAPGINNSQNNKVSVGDITVVTQASSPDGIADALHKRLGEMIWQTNSNFDDGVFA